MSGDAIKPPAESTARQPEPASGKMSLTWTLRGAGWARCDIADEQSQAEIGSISYISAAPEDFLTAVARLTAGETETRVEFESEPAIYRWIFNRRASDVQIRVLVLPEGHGHDYEGIELWVSRQTVDSVARAVVRCFDRVAVAHSEEDYLDRWRSQFPRAELEALRGIWRRYRQAASSRPRIQPGGASTGVDPERW